MTMLMETRLADLLEPYMQAALPEALLAERVAKNAQASDPATLHASLLRYLELLLQWNAKTNITAIRPPEQIVERHFGESLFVGRCLQTMLCPGAEVLDFGSGAGFPGIPIQLLLPDIRMTLAESQRKKAAFLREALRTTGAAGTVWADRVEALPSERSFDTVTMRAVDRQSVARVAAWPRVRQGGWLAEVLGDTEAQPQENALLVRVPGLRLGWLRLTKKL